IAEDPVKPATTSFGAAFRLLGDRTLLFLFLGILFVVGVDVGMNTATPKFLMEKTGMALEKAGWGTSIYFAARTAGALIGAILLAKYSARLFFKISMFVAIVALAIQLFLDQAFGIFVTVAVIGFAVANVFSILFSMALQRKPERANEISGLMVMGIAGGALMPPIMGLMADWMGQSGALLVILACMLYLLGASFWVKSR
ncbi:MAG TPA: MFS transporter, partial [Prolixibacteraceae bacterium]|nr:MFS transporter [Prolixibacteraceae bacterium]